MITNTKHSRFPEIALILITIIWGGTFLIVQHALTLTSPMFFVGCRFLIAACVVSFFSLKILKGTTLKDLAAGAAIGATITLGYGAQTVGLQTILSSESAFLTALYVPLVPLFQWVMFKKAPQWSTWTGIIFAFIGLVLLTGNHTFEFSLSTGQAITVFGAFAIALEIIFIGLFAKHVNLQRVTILQLLFASLFAFMSMPLMNEHSIPEFSWTLILILLSIGLSSAIIQFTMNWAQQYVDPARATLIYAGEPVWAGIFGRIAGERLSPYALIGALFVLIGIIISEFKPEWFKKRSRD
ncbi:DMT family transporter [Acinetobacter apis]|uniref:EamA-like transporter family protein n=1 Tax=Acinetobacter apis TaxID=1229165 RepID=A0A217EIQ6_9GAMM|nr:DMT family transporter [Acinetobacter apis]SNQ30236.1 EamA-like transporter family protein [Acinetobacter apis]